jgi:hypothetical protein
LLPDAAGTSYSMASWPGRAPDEVVPRLIDLIVALQDR